MIQGSYNSNGIKINYFEAGSGSDLLFLHGGGLDAGSYKKAILFFSSKYHVIAPDIPGFGSSGFPTGDWDFNDYSECLIRLARHLKLRRYVLVGYSFGGGIAVNIAARDKGISRLVLCSSSGIPLNISIAGLLSGR